MLNQFIKMLGVMHPKTGQVDVILSLVVFAVVICGIKFLFDGMTITIAGHIIAFGHTDSLSYGSILSPILGAHGYMEGKNSDNVSLNRVDDPENFT